MLVRQGLNHQQQARHCWADPLLQTAMQPWVAAITFLMLARIQAVRLCKCRKFVSAVSRSSCRLGSCTKVDLSQAKQWAAKAAEQGSREGQQLLQRLQAKQGSEKEWAKAMRKMQAGVPQGATGAEAAGEAAGCM